MLKKCTAWKRLKDKKAEKKCTDKEWRGENNNRNRTMCSSSRSKKEQLCLWLVCPLYVNKIPLAYLRWTAVAARAVHLCLGSLETLFGPWIQRVFVWVMLFHYCSLPPRYSAHWEPWKQEVFHPLLSSSFSLSLPFTTPFCPHHIGPQYLKTNRNRKSQMLT